MSLFRADLLALLCIALIGTGIGCSSSTLPNTHAGNTDATTDAGGIDAASSNDAGSCVERLMPAGRCGTQIETNATSCDIELQVTPPAIYETVVAIDCGIVHMVSPDAGTSGWVIDVSAVPAHLLLLGNACDVLREPGPHEIEIVVRCTCAC